MSQSTYQSIWSVNSTNQ